jgi:hypothetical protein
MLMKEFPQSASRLQEAARGRLRQLQIAGRAGTATGPDSGEDGGGAGRDDEDRDQKAKWDDFRRQRRTAITRFATGAPPAAPAPAGNTRPRRSVLPVLPRVLRALPPFLPWSGVPPFTTHARRR